MNRRKPLSRLSLSILMILMLGTAAPAFAAPPDTRSLRAEVQKVLAEKNVAASTVGVIAIDADTGDILLEENADALFNPASNTKLVTAAVALDALGPSHTIFTRVSAPEVKEGVVKGSLYLKGDGDPLILYEDVLKWALELKRQGITRVEDGIIVDDLSFAEGFIPPAYDQKKEDAAYRAPIGAVSVNFNHVVVKVEPAKPGDEAKVSLYPPNEHVQVINKVKTRLGKTRRVRIKSITTDDGKGTRIEVSGAIGTGVDEVTSRKRIDNPSLFAGAVFAQALRDVGIEVLGEVRRGARPDKTTSLVLHESKPLIYQLMLMNKWSNNFMAEQIFRVVGTGPNDEPATTERAYERVRAFMKAAGADDSFQPFNGSGLYDGNKYSPRHLAFVLKAMHEHRFGPDFAATLAIAGTDGTLVKRLKDTDGELRGKTGTLNEVTALGGYVRTEGGRNVAYVILFNDTPVRAWNMRPQQDAIARAIADFEN